MISEQWTFYSNLLEGKVVQSEIRQLEKIELREITFLIKRHTAIFNKYQTSSAIEIRMDDVELDVNSIRVVRSHCCDGYCGLLYAEVDFSEKDVRRVLCLAVYASPTRDVPADVWLTAGKRLLSISDTMSEPKI